MNSDLFVKAIKGLLDDTNLFDRKEWANLLDVFPTDIDRWVKGKEIPRSDHLMMIYSILEMNQIVGDAVEFFKQIAEFPADKVSSHGEKMLPTVWAYMQKPVVEW